MILLLIPAWLSVAGVLALHLAWATWMVAGVVSAVAGFRWPRFWTWKTFRIAHLAGLLLTATVPLWNRGICPLTFWEWALDAGRVRTGVSEPFLTRLIRSVLYINVPPAVITAITALAAAATLWIFLTHPPRRSPRSGASGEGSHGTGAKP